MLFQPTVMPIRSDVDGAQVVQVQAHKPAYEVGASSQLKLSLPQKPGNIQLYPKHYFCVCCMMNYASNLAKNGAGIG